MISSEETAETSKNYPKTSKSLGRTDPKTRPKETGRSRSPLNRTIFMAIKMVMGRDNNAEGIVFRKRCNKQETFSGGLKASKSNLKTYSRNLEKNNFRSEIYDFVVFFS